MIDGPQKKQFDYVLIDLAFARSEAFMRSSRMEIEMNAANNTKAIEAFMARKMEVDAMLDRLQALSGDHFGCSPNDINWGHVGTLAHYAELLKRITDCAFNEGEHAA